MIFREGIFVDISSPSAQSAGDRAHVCPRVQDFHRRFAPRCSVCRQPIMPTPGQDETVRVVALDRSFHVDCYRSAGKYLIKIFVLTCCLGCAGAWTAACC